MSDKAAPPAASPVPMASNSYPLPDDLYPGSKDWTASDYAGRVEWLHVMYESAKKTIATLEEHQVPMASSAGEPWYGHEFKEMQRGVWRCECGKTLVPAASLREQERAHTKSERNAYFAEWERNVDKNKGSAT